MAAPSTLYQVYRDAFDRAKSPTATVEQCEKAGLNAVVRHTIHWLADVAELSRKSEKHVPEGENAVPEIRMREMTGSELAAAFRTLTEK